jgi:ketosteroid isomerase-like protein
MSDENVEIVRQLAEVFRTRDGTAEASIGERELAAITDALDPDIEWDATRTFVEDLGGTYHGHNRVAEWWGRWLEAWETIEFEMTELIDAGDHVFLWIQHQTMRGRGSGLEVDAPPYGWVFTFRDGKMTRGALYLEREEALEAAGLS